MLSPAAVALLLQSVQSALAPGDYRIVYDRVETTELEWDLMCEAPPVPAALEKGTAVRLVTDGAKFLLTAPKRRIGTEACDAETSTVLPTKVTIGVSEVRVACATKRVVRGTEQGETVYRFKVDGTIEARTVMKRHWRHSGESCGLQRVRATMFERVPSGSVEDLVAAAARQADWAELKIDHANKLPKAYTIVSARYELDTRPVLKGELEEDWGPIAPGRARSVYSALVPQGPHVLAVELVFEVAGTAKPMRVRMRDTVFFDALERPIKIQLVSEERDVLFPELKDRARLRFEVEGAGDVAQDVPASP